MSYILISSVRLYDPKVSMLDVMTSVNDYMNAGRRCWSRPRCCLGAAAFNTIDPPPYWNTHQMILLHHVFTLTIACYYEEEQDPICNRTMIKP